MPAAAETFAISKRYDGRQRSAAFALRDVTAEFPMGQVTGLLGHNGAGKSTLIKLMLGLIAPTTGRVSVLGMDPLGPESRSLRMRIGYLPENLALYDNLTGHEVLAYLAGLKHTKQEETTALLERVGLADAADQRVRTYSKGMRQRLGLAQVLLGSPDVLLLDEPVAGLDPSATQDFFRLVGELRSAGKSVVISSHLLGELEPHLDRAVILGHGRLLTQGSITELYTRAGLPTIITARFGRKLNGTSLDPGLLAGLPVTLRQCDDGRIEITVPAESKMVTVHKLMTVPALTDIEVHKPTLVHLYESMSAFRTPADGEAGSEHDQ